MPEIKDELRKFHEQKQKLPNIYSGSLGILINGEKVVEVPNRPGFVFVRLQNMQSEFVQALNGVVSPVYDLPVLVTHNNSYYAIYGRDVNRYSNWVTNSAYVPAHHTQHEFDISGGGGGDVVWVHSEQFYPLLGFPSGSAGANNIVIAPYTYFYNSKWMSAGNTGTANLLSYKPTGSVNAKTVLVTVNASSGNPAYHVSNEYLGSITGTSALAMYYPTTINPATEIPVAAVRLVTGTSEITWANIYDVRQFYGISSASGTSGGASTFTGLTDTPASYAGASLKAVRVNVGETALEFVDFPTSTGSSSSTGTADLSLIMLIQPNGGGTTTYPVTNAGLDSALAALTSGGKIKIPSSAGVLLNTGTHTITQSCVIEGDESARESLPLIRGQFVFNPAADIEVTFRNISATDTRAGSTMATTFINQTVNEIDLFIENSRFVANGTTNSSIWMTTGGVFWVNAWNSAFEAYGTTALAINAPNTEVFGAFISSVLVGTILESDPAELDLHNTLFSDVTGAYSGYYAVTSWPVDMYNDRAGFFVDGTPDYDNRHSLDIYKNVPVRHMPVPTVTGSFAYVSDLAQGWKEKSFDDAVVDVLKKHGLL